LGHATRCIPIIEALIEADFCPVIASDGNALKLLQKEFPTLKSYTLPSYNIKYTKSGKNLMFKLLLSVPSIYTSVKEEQKIVDDLIKKENLEGIISDNRFGVFSKKTPSVYISHQINVLSGITTFFTSKLHQRIIKKFDECWVPDNKDLETYSGKLGHPIHSNLKLKYLGILSRLKRRKLHKKNDLMVLLSGPEPQRSILERKLLMELRKYEGSVLFVRGIISEQDIIKAPSNFKIVNYLLSNELETTINESDLIVSRSGYTSIMDMAILGKKAFFIPTPGQFEQEYLAKYLNDKKIAPFSTQDNFTVDQLKKLKNYSGFNTSESKFDLNLFSLFNGE